MYPSIEVSRSNTLRHIVIPNGIRFMTWKVDVRKDDEGNLVHTLGYALYPVGKKDPVISGYCNCINSEIDSDKAILDLLGAIFFTNWSFSNFDYELLSLKEFSEYQVDWLSSPEVDPIFEILEGYEQEGEGLNPQERGYEWHNNRICDVGSLSPLFKDINLN